MDQWILGWVEVYGLYRMGSGQDASGLLSFSGLIVHIVLLCNDLRIYFSTLAVLEL